MSERVQKLLAATGIASRRAIEDWIRAGRITLNGRAAKLGDRASPQDELRLDGKPIALPRLERAAAAVLLYHKPVGEVTTRSDPQGRPTVFDNLPKVAAGRWIAVGRLDVGTSGLLLFTTDGELAHRLMHPSSEVEREYLVRVRGHLPGDALERLRSGVRLADGVAHFDSITPGRVTGGHSWFTVRLHEGRNREVRRMFEAVGAEVSRLTRLRFGPVSLPDDLPPRAHVPLRADEVLALTQASLGASA